MFKLTIYFLFIFLTLTSRAQILVPSGITHGAEIEFTNDWIYEIDSPDKIGVLRGREQEAAQVLADAIWSKCAQFRCKVTRVEGKWGPEHRVTLPNGWWFQVSYDPLCVEIQTKPATLQELYPLKDVMEELLFKTAADVGLLVKPTRSTHMNTGARSAFGYNVRNLFNYFVDNANHPELASGVFRKNWKTSPPITALGPNPAKAIATIQKRIETRKIVSFAQLANEIEIGIYHAYPDPRYDRSRNHELNFIKLKSLQDVSPSRSERDMPIERRAVRAMRSFQEFIMHAELIEYRIAWTKKYDGFIPYNYKKANHVSAGQARSFFQGWLQEMNVPMERYESLITVSPLAAKKRSSAECIQFYF